MNDIYIHFINKNLKEVLCPAYILIRVFLNNALSKAY